MITCIWLLILRYKQHIPGSNNINLRNKSYGYEKMCLSKDLIESKLYHLIGQFNERQKVAKTFIW